MVICDEGHGILREKAGTVASCSENHCRAMSPHCRGRGGLSFACAAGLVLCVKSVLVTLRLLNRQRGPFASRRGRGGRHVAWGLLESAPAPDRGGRRFAAGPKRGLVRRDDCDRFFGTASEEVAARRSGDELEAARRGDSFTPCIDHAKNLMTTPCARHRPDPSIRAGSGSPCPDR